MWHHSNDCRPGSRWHQRGYRSDSVPKTVEWRRRCMAGTQPPSQHGGPRTRQHKLTVGHDDVIKWKHFLRYWPFVRGIHRSPVNSPHKGQWRGALMFSLICALNKRLSKQWWCWWFETPSCPLWRHCNVNASTPKQNGRHFADNIFDSTFLNEKCCIFSGKMFPMVQVTISQYFRPRTWP